MTLELGFEGQVGVSQGAEARVEGSARGIENRGAAVGVCDDAILARG